MTSRIRAAILFAALWFLACLPALAQNLNAYQVTTLQNAATATGNGTSLDTTPMAAVSVQITGTFVGTVTFEGTMDGSNWIALEATNANDDTRATTATAPGIYSVVLHGSIRFRARVSAYTSGDITVKARLQPGMITRNAAGGGGGSGTVTTFSAGNLSPLFTSSVANATSTPALSFSLSNATANRVFAGPTTGSPAAPTFRALVTGDLPSGIPYGNLNLTGAILNADLAGSIANAKLANSSVTIAGTSVSLGGSISQDAITGLAATGLVKRTGANTLAAAVSGTDYAPATSGSAILKGNGTGGFSSAVAGTDYLAPSGSGASLTNVVNSITGTTNQVTASAATGAVTLSLPQDIGTASNVRHGNLGLNVAAPTSGGQIAATLGANNVTGITLKRNTDTAPTGNYFDFQSAAGTTIAKLDVAGALTVTSCSGCGGGTAANPTASVGLSAVNGVATTFMRSDAAPALDQTIAPTWTGAHSFGNTIALTSTTAANNKITQGAALNIGTTSTDGIILQNTTAAAPGTQQYSPRLRFTGQGSKTNATAASQTVDWIVENQPVQGAANPSTNLVFSYQVNGGGYSPKVTISSGTSGEMTVSGFSDSNSALVMGGIGSQPTLYFRYAGGNRNYIQGAGGGGNDLVFFSTSTPVANFSSTTGLFLPTASIIGFTSTVTVPSADLTLRRAAAANLALGAADAAAPVAQTISVQNVVAGTSNTAGATRTEIASLGTSQGAPGRFHLQAGAMIAASGTTQQTAVDRLIVGATKVLTNNSATTITNVTVGAGTSTGGTLSYCVEVTDGTDTQYECGRATFGVSNKGGVFSGNTVTKVGNQQNATAGTLTVTFAISGANPALLSVNANSSLTPSTGYPRITYSLQNLGQQSVAIQ